MKQKIITVLLVLTLICLGGCTALQSTSQTQLSPLQLRELTTRTYQGNEDNIFKAVMNVLQDQQYLIMNTDSKAGLIMAEKEVEKSATVGELLNVFFINANAATTKGATVKITATLNTLNEEETEVRISAQEVTYKSNQYGDKKGKAINIQSPEVYKAILDQISVEIERIKARG